MNKLFGKKEEEKVSKVPPPLNENNNNNNNNNNEKNDQSLIIIDEEDEIINRGNLGYSFNLQSRLAEFHSNLNNNELKIQFIDYVIELVKFGRDSNDTLFSGFLSQWEDQQKQWKEWDKNEIEKKKLMNEKKKKELNFGTQFNEKRNSNTSAVNKQERIENEKLYFKKTLEEINKLENETSEISNFQMFYFITKMKKYYRSRSSLEIGEIWEISNNEVSTNGKIWNYDGHLKKKIGNFIIIPILFQKHWILIKIESIEVNKVDLTLFNTLKGFVSDELKNQIKKNCIFKNSKWRSYNKFDRKGCWISARFYKLWLLGCKFY